MLVNIVTVLALASSFQVALAHPYGHKHLHRTGTRGTGTALPAPVQSDSAAPFPVNGTNEDAEAGFNRPNNVVAAAAQSTSCTYSKDTATATSFTYVTRTANADDQAPAAAVTSEAAPVVEVATSSKPIVAAQLQITSSADMEVHSVSAAAFYERGSRGGSTPAAATPDTVAVNSAAPASAASAAPATSSGITSSSGTNISSGGKKGLSYNIASLTGAFSGSNIAWAYNWGQGPDGTLLPGIEYVPMLWGAKTLNGWTAAAAKAIAAGSRHALSFNEPDHKDQANMTPADAAKGHIDNMNPLASQGVKIGSVAITNGAGTNPLMGVDYLDAWFKACNGQCKVDFVAYHWYNGAGLIQDFKDQTQRVIDVAAKYGVSKVWCTEFGATGSDADVANFMKQAVEFLDNKAEVERYAYFMVQDGILTNGGKLSTIGSAYASA